MLDVSVACIQIGHLGPKEASMRTKSMADFIVNEAKEKADVIQTKALEECISQSADHWTMACNPVDLVQMACRAFGLK